MNILCTDYRTFSDAQIDKKTLKKDSVKNHVFTLLKIKEEKGQKNTEKTVKFPF